MKASHQYQVVTSSKEFGEAIRAQRKAKGLTQHEIAHMSPHIASRCLSEIERGKPTAQIGKALVLAHDVNFDVLLLDTRLTPKVLRALQSSDGDSVE